MYEINYFNRPFLGRTEQYVYFGGLCYLTIRVLSLSMVPNYTALSHGLKIMLKYVLGWISRSHEMNPSMKPGASKQTQRRMEGLSSWRDGRHLFSCFSSGRRPSANSTQSGRPEEHMVRGAPQYPRVPYAPFQINTRVHLARRDPPSAQTEQAENKCRAPKQINLRAIQNARDRILFILAKGKHGDRALNIWGDPCNGEVSQSSYIVNRKVIKGKCRRSRLEK